MNSSFIIIQFDAHIRPKFLINLKRFQESIYLYNMIYYTLLDKPQRSLVKIRVQKFIMIYHMQFSCLKSLQVRKLGQNKDRSNPNQQIIFPGAYVIVDSNKKKQYDSLIGYFFEQDKSINIVNKILGQLKNQIDQTIKKCQEKTGVDLSVQGSKKTLKIHLCKYCGKVFYKAQALGGHISKTHPNKKKEKRHIPKKTKKIEKIKSEVPSGPNQIKDFNYIDMLK